MNTFVVATSCSSIFTTAWANGAERSLCFTKTWRDHVSPEKTVLPEHFGSGGFIFIILRWCKVSNCHRSVVFERAFTTLCFVLSHLALIFPHPYTERFYFLPSDSDLMSVKSKITRPLYNWSTNLSHAQTPTWHTVRLRQILNGFTPIKQSINILKSSK